MSEKRGRGFGRPFTKDNAKEHGRTGGNATLKVHGIDHMREIGKLGFRATANKYYNGDGYALMVDLREKGLLNAADREIGPMLRLYQQKFPGMFDDL